MEGGMGKERRRTEIGEGREARERDNRRKGKERGWKKEKG